MPSLISSCILACVWDYKDSCLHLLCRHGEPHQLTSSACVQWQFDQRQLLAPVVTCEPFCIYRMCNVTTATCSDAPACAVQQAVPGISSCQIRLCQAPTSCTPLTADVPVHSRPLSRLPCVQQDCTGLQELLCCSDQPYVAAAHQQHYHLLQWKLCHGRSLPCSLLV